MATQSWATNTAAKASAAPLDGTEIIRVIDGGVSRRATTNDMRALAGIPPVYVSGRWYTPDSRELGLGAGLAMNAANTLRLTPAFIHRAVTISELGAVVTTGEAGRNIQLGVYASSATTALPTTLIGRTGSMTTDATGAKNAAITGGNVALPVGLVWWGINTDGTAVACTVGTSGGLTGSIAIGSTTLGNVIGNAVTLTALTTAMTFNTWTADITANSFTEITNSRRAQLAFKVA